MSREEEASSGCCHSIDDDDDTANLSESGIQQNLSHVTHQLTHNLLAGHAGRNYSLSSLIQSPPTTMSQENGAGNMPDFDELYQSGAAFSLLGEGKKETAEARIESKTSEYFSAENNTSQSNVEKDSESVEMRRVSNPPNSGEDIDRKRASLVKSREMYSSIEYDPSRRQSIPVLAHSDSVFSEEQPPISPQRKHSRERLVKQKSQSTSDLPDLIQPSPVPSPTSPDVVPVVDFFRKRVKSEETLSPAYQKEACVDFLNDKLRKQEIEGRVHDGNATKPYFRRSVSFSDKPIVIGVADVKEQSTASETRMPPLSPHGEEGRQYFRELKDSGYRTGSSSKGSLQSQISNLTNLSDSVLTDTSVDKEDENEFEEEPDLVPVLSIFESSNFTLTEKSKSLYADGLPDSLKPHNIEDLPNLSIFKSTSASSDGSLCLKSNEFAESFHEANINPAQACQDLPSGVAQEAETSPTEAHENYADKILVERIKQGAWADPVKCAQNSRCPPPRDRSLQQQAFMEVYQDQIKKIDPMAKPENYMKLLTEMPSDSSTPSPSPHDRLSLCDKQQKLISNIADYSALFRVTEGDLGRYDGSLSPDFDLFERLKDQIERAGRCQFKRCDDLDCKRTKKTLQNFDDGIMSNWPLDFELERVLFALRCHSERCEELKCSVPYCSILGRIDPWNKIDAICQIRQKLDVILHLTEGHESGRFMSLSPEYESRRSMLEGQDWLALASLNVCKTVALISDLTRTNSVCSVLKMVAQLEGEQQWSVYERLRGLTHVNVVRHLWMLEQGPDLLVCTQFMGDGTLRHKLQESPTRLPLNDVICYVQQVIRGMIALHQLGIIYINWTSCNVLLSGGGKVAKVTNFSLSVCGGANNVDFGDVKNSLPPAILPPELLCGSPSIKAVSDSWGCGCLLYELLQGREVWHQFRHETKDFIWRKLQGKVPPLPQELHAWPRVFRACWQPKMEERRSLEDISSILSTQHVSIQRVQQ